jgi:BON domain
MFALVFTCVAVPTWTPPPIIGDPRLDSRHTLQARRLLLEDPDLASFNIGVIVTDRVAVLWGPVPSAEVAFRAEVCVKAMAELVRVKNETFLNDPMEPSRVPLKIDVPSRMLPDVAPKAPNEPRPVIGAPGVLTAKKPAVAVLPPEAPEPSLAAAVRSFLSSDPAFRNVEFAVKDRRVYLKVADQDGDAVHEAARGISRWPNVDGVVLVDKILR